MATMADLSTTRKRIKTLFQSCAFHNGICLTIFLIVSASPANTEATKTIGASVYALLFICIIIQNLVFVICDRKMKAILKHAKSIIRQDEILRGGDNEYDFCSKEATMWPTTPTERGQDETNIKTKRVLPLALLVLCQFCTTSAVMIWMTEWGSIMFCVLAISLIAQSIGFHVIRHYSSFPIAMDQLSDRGKCSATIPITNTKVIHF